LGHFDHALLKTRRDAGSQNVGAGKFRHARSGPAAQSIWMTDFSDLSAWMTEFSVTRMLCSSGTLDFL
jgi:hypothetical protein